MKKILVFILCCSFFISCKKSTQGPDTEVTGMVKDFTGLLDGCQMMIVLEDGSKLEVHSVPSGITLQDGKKVAIRYNVMNSLSICMAGPIVEITYLRYL